MKTIIPFLLILLFMTGCTKNDFSTATYSSTKTSDFTDKSSKVDMKDYSPSVFEEKQVIIEDDINTIGILFPSQNIGKYALEATNSINTYLLNKNYSFTLKVYDIEIQNKKNIINAIAKLKEDNVKKVIAMVTKESLPILKDLDNIEDIKFYLPLVNKYDVGNIDMYQNLDLIFGAISYKKQFKKLIAFAEDKPLVEFYGNSGIGKTLHSYLKNQKILFTKKIDDNNGRYKNFLEDNKKLDNSVVLLNTPIVKSSILLSAINSQELAISSIVSTQLNYTPLLFSLTQRHDRKKLIVASSIGKIPYELEEYNKLIGNNLSYSWVNYSTIIGVEYLLNNNIDIFDDLLIEKKQVVFPVHLYKVGNSSFKLIK